MKEFKVGDVVVLNSGGPRMTITGPSGADSWQCSWVSASGELCVTFPAVCLRCPTPQDEWRETRGLPTYARRGRLRVCQDCGGIATDRLVYGIKRWMPDAERSGVTFEIIDWLIICDPCAKARGFSVPE